MSAHISTDIIKQSNPNHYKDTPRFAKVPRITIISDAWFGHILAFAFVFQNDYSFRDFVSLTVAGHLEKVVFLISDNQRERGMAIV